MTPVLARIAQGLARVEVEQLRRAQRLALCLGNGLALFPRQNAPKLVFAGQQQVARTAQHI